MIYIIISNKFTSNLRNKITKGENETSEIGFILTKNMRKSFIDFEFGSIVRRKSHFNVGIYKKTRHLNIFKTPKKI